MPSRGECCLQRSDFSLQRRRGGSALLRLALGLRRRSAQACNLPCNAASEAVCCCASLAALAGPLRTAAISACITAAAAARSCSAPSAFAKASCSAAIWLCIASAAAARCSPARSAI